MPKIITRSRRRICIETHRFSYDNDKGGSENSDSYYETCFLLMMDPIKGSHKDNSDKIEDKEVAPLSESAPDDASIHSTGSDDGTLAGAFSDMDTAFGKTKTAYEGWCVRYQFPLKAVTIQKVKNNSVTFKVQHREINHLRKIKFEKAEEAEECSNCIRGLKSTEEARLDAKYKESVKRLGKNISVNAKEQICFLVEIVGATDLPRGDVKSSDPYVKCYFDGMEVHKTGYLRKK